LLASRSIPHATIGVSRAELLFNRKLRTKLPIIQDRPESVLTEVRDRDSESKGKAKLYQDKKRNAKPSEIQPGDQVLVRQKKQDKLTTTFVEIPPRSSLEKRKQPESEHQVEQNTAGTPPK